MTYSIDTATVEQWDAATKKWFQNKEDPVDNPHHYNQGTIECIDAIRASMSTEQFKGYCKGNVLKYTWRSEYKNGIEDLRKARWYLERWIQEEVQ